MVCWKAPSASQKQNRCDWDITWFFQLCPYFIFAGIKGIKGIKGSKCLWTRFQSLVGFAVGLVWALRGLSGTCEDWNCNSSCCCHLVPYLFQKMKCVTFLWLRCKKTVFPTWNQNPAKTHFHWVVWQHFISLIYFTGNVGCLAIKTTTPMIQCYSHPLFVLFLKVSTGNQMKRTVTFDNIADFSVGLNMKLTA